MDVIHNTTTIHFGFADRLKILFGCKAVVTITIETTNEVVNCTKSTAKTNVPLPSWMRRKYSGGFVETGGEQTPPEKGLLKN